MSATTTGTGINLQGVNGADADMETGIELGYALIRLAEGVAERDAGRLTEARRMILASAGAAVLVDAAGVAANFQRMTRIADATGIPVDNMDSELGQNVRAELGIGRFASARNTPGGTGTH